MPREAVPKQAGGGPAQRSKLYKRDLFLHNSLDGWKTLSPGELYPQEQPEPPGLTQLCLDFHGVLGWFMV